VKNKLTNSRTFALLVIAAAASLCSAQSGTPTPSPLQQSPTVTDSKAGDKPTAAQPTRGDSIKRWFEIDALTLSPRYRFVENNAGVTTNNQAQWQFAGRGKFKFDRKGRYSVNMGLFTGNALTSGWNNTGIGTGRGQSNLYLKHLYFNAKPVKWLEAQIGSFAVNNGENTEITGYDNDAYIMGERVRVRAPKQAYFDEISYTAAFVGAANRPGVFRRMDHFDEWNYHQLLVRKQVSKRVGFSADYTFERPSHTLRQAVRIKVPELRVLDAVLFENYQRVEPDLGYGFNLYGEKALNKKFTLSGGFARIDRPMLNADRFPPGKRVHINSAYKISPEFTVSTALIHGVGHLASAQTPRTRLDIIFTYNFLETLRKLKLQ
jgi:hypothetical protein